MTIGSIGDINREILNRTRALGLHVDCGSDGSFGASIAVVGEAPGERERILKLPLTGASGKVFWDHVRPIGINRRGVYITNVVKRQLRQGDDTKSEVTSGEYGQYAEIVRWELQQLPNLRHIIVLGNYALEAVTGYTGILHHRGSVYDIQLQSVSQGINRSVRVICLMNPAAIMREKKWEVLYKFDVGRLDDVLKGKYKPHTISPIINPSPREAIEYIDKLHDEQLPVSLDIETISNETACIGFANNPHSGMCINFRDQQTNRFTLQEEADVRFHIQRFVRSPNTRLVMQNGMFDSYWLWCKDRIRLGPAYFDTMLAHHTLYPTLPHNLGFITSQYTTHPFYKDEGDFWREGGNINQFWEYNVKDCCITWAAHEKMLRELQTQGLSDFFFSHVMRLQPHLIRMTAMGVLADAKLKDQIAEEVKRDVDALLAEFKARVTAATGDPDYKPNPGSPKQMRELYFGRLRLVGRGTSVDVKNRVRMKDHVKTSEEAKAVLVAHDKYAKEKKFAQYAVIKVDEDGRIRTEYKQTGVQSAPGRLSSAQVMWGSGTNLQNQPLRAQKMYIADDGYEFSYFDLQQAEAQVVARRAVIHQWIEDYEQARINPGFDAHRSLASVMFKIPYDQVPKEDWEEDGVTPSIRYKSKRCRHGLNYTLGPDNLAEQIGVGYNEGFNLHALYHRTNPEINRWWSWQYERVRATRVIFNAYGRRWLSLERIDPDILGTIVAFYPQSTIGDKVSRCIYLCESDPEWPSSARMLLNIHDALIAIHKTEDGETCRRIMKKHAEEPLTVEGVDGKNRTFIIPCDLKKSVSTLVDKNGKLIPHEDGYHRWDGMAKVKLNAA